VKILLERDEVNPDKPDNDGRTPLLYAAGNGYAEVVEILLGRDDVDPSKPDEYGQTPPAFAGGQVGLQIAGRLLVRPGQANARPTWAFRPGF